MNQALDFILSDKPLNLILIVFLALILIGAIGYVCYLLATSEERALKKFSKMLKEIYEVKKFKNEKDI